MKLKFFAFEIDFNFRFLLIRVCVFLLVLICRQSNCQKSRNAANGRSSIWWTFSSAIKWTIRHFVCSHRPRHWARTHWTKASAWNSKMIQWCRPPFRRRPATVWWTFPIWWQKRNRTKPASTITRICIPKCRSITTITMAARSTRRRYINRMWTNRWAATATMPAVAMGHVAAHRSAWMHRMTMMTTMISSHRWHTRQSICRNITTLIKCVFSEWNSVWIPSQIALFFSSSVVFAVVEQFPRKYVQRIP